ncbi:MAG TPA: diguanylate cyclase [Gammaproteobacteria bacterium]|nr:diguanylate cyclase [Gammaproteobacteria bacterium]
MEDAKILLVDDKRENLIAMQKTLAPLKLNIITAQSGNEALKLMLMHEFAVVLLDVMMPDMNGFEVADLMHENDATKNMPIIFITAINKSEQYYIKGMEAGAIDYLYKPVDPTILLSKVRIFVDLYTARNKLEKTIAELNSFQEQLKETNLQLKQLSEVDALTSVSNRRHFQTELSNLLETAKQNNATIWLFFIDVDDFKTINDTYGHRVGDLVLITLTERVKKVSDTIKITARLGGDEFAAVIYDKSRDQGTIETIAKQMLQAMQAPFVCDNVNLQVSISIGITDYPAAGITVTDLLRTADLALYKAKGSGKNNYAVFQPDQKSQ